MLKLIGLFDEFELILENLSVCPYTLSLSLTEIDLNIIGFSSILRFVGILG